MLRILEEDMKFKFNLKFSVKIIFYILYFFCLIPFLVNFKTLKLKFSLKSILWCVIFSLILILIDPYLEKVVYKSLVEEISYSGISVRIFTRGTHIMVLICVYSSIFQINQIFKIAKLLKRIFEKLSKFGEEFSDSDSIWNKVLIKLLAVQTSAIIVHYSYSLFMNNGLVSLIILYTPITAFTYTIGSAMLLKFNVFCILLRIGFSTINRAIWKINRLNCEICDKIDELAKIYCKLYQASILILRMFVIPILTYLGYIFIMIEHQFFSIYLSFTDKSGYGLVGIICLFAFCLVRLAELVIVLQDINLVVKEVTFFI